MAYLGSGLEEVEKTVATCNMVCDTMTGNGSLATMTIGASQNVPAHINNVSVYFDGVAQRPTVDYTLAGKTVTFTTAPENGVKVVCLSYASEYLDVISDATVSSSEISDGAITDAKIASGISVTKLSGALPAIDGSAVTNFSIRAVVKNASDPTISTNHANGVGTLWANTTSGEMYICTDATAGANVWTNIGGGEGAIEPFYFPGSNFGYATGGILGGSTSQNVIEKYSYTTQANATDVGDLTDVRQHHSGHRSKTDGYVGGGDQATTNIQKFSFTTDGNAVDSGSDLSTARSRMASASTGTHGYVMSGTELPAWSYATVAEKFSYASSGAASNVGNMTTARGRPAGHSSATHGYASGGDLGPSYTNVIDRVSFASDGNATDHGDLSQARAARGAGGSSTTHGYTVGGNIPPNNNSTVIDKWAFASNTTATDWGDFSTAVRSGSTTSSTTHIYTAGGRAAGSSDTNVIQRWALASGGTATDHADITVVRYGLVGTQY